MSKIPTKLISATARFCLALVVFSSLMMVSAKAASAATYYVDPVSGDDSRVGTSTSTAWKTIEKALENGGIAQGDTLYLMAGTHNTFKSGTDNWINPVIATGNGSGTITITANPGDEGNVVISMPGTTSTSIGYFHLNHPGLTFLFENLTFLNNNGGSPVAADWFYTRQGKLMFTNVVIDNNNETTKTIFNYKLTSEGAEVEIRQSIIKNTGSYIVYCSVAGTFKMSSSIISDNSSSLALIVGPGSDPNMSIELINNTFYQTKRLFAFSTGLKMLKFVNNIAYISTNSNIFNSNANLEEWAHNNINSNFIFKNNILWKVDITSMGVNPGWNTIVFDSSSAYFVDIDKTNRLLNPSFSNAPADLSISSTSHILGLGDTSYLPVEGDFGGNSWIGADVGAYAMPSSTTYQYTLTENKAAFLGDSIFGCAGPYFGADSNCIYRKFATLTGLDVADAYIGNATYKPAISGGSVETGPFLADYILENVHPKFVFVSLGINNVWSTDSTSDNHPANVTYQEVADTVKKTMDKLDDYGVVPIWMGILSLRDGTTESDAVNAAMEDYCTNNDWVCGSSLDQMKLNSSWQTTYYDDNRTGGLTNNAHPDKDGHELMANLAQALYTEATTPPTISSLDTDLQPTSVTLTWETNNNASTKVDYGLTTSYGSSTPETDVDPRVKNHSKSLSGLTTCASYHYRARSTDTRGNEKVGSDNSFTTTGCIGSASVESQNSSTITTASGGSLNLLSSGKGIDLTVPTSFAGSDANFQIKKLDKNSVLNTTALPSGYSAAGSYIYDLKALSDVSTAITTFNNPITITVTYDTSDVTGMNESSLKIYRWDGSNWSQLSNCSVNTSSHTITCTTTHFSVFGLFGQQTSSESTPSNNNSSSSSSTPSAPSCTSRSPVGQPDLFQIDRSGTTAKLYFTPVNDLVESYHVIFGFYDEDERFGGINMQAMNENQGVQSITVDHLDKNKTYSFKVVSVNGCAPGEWSNWLTAGKPQAPTSIFYRYWDKVRNLLK